MRTSIVVPFPVVSPPNAAARVMVVDDDATVSGVVTKYLRREGFEVETESDGRAALMKAVASPPDLVVLDLMLPGMDGLEVFRRLREAGPVPVIMLTARGSEDERVLGLDLGADDYLPKPFSPRELMARVRSVLRRAHSPVDVPWIGQGRAFRVGRLELDVAAHEARVEGRTVSLTTREFELLSFLMAHPNRAFRREELLERVWGYSFGDTSTVTVHVRRLREKVEADPARPTMISTVWGVGYRFDGEVE